MSNVLFDSMIGLSGASTPDQSGPGSDGNKAPQSSSITEASPSVSYQAHTYSSAEMQSVFSATQADWATCCRESYSNIEMQSVFSATQADWATCCRESYSNVEMQSVFSATQVDWATCCRESYSSVEM